jgi:hypothetical protein
VAREDVVVQEGIFQVINQIMPPQTSTREGKRNNEAARQELV